MVVAHLVRVLVGALERRDPAGRGAPASDHRLTKGELSADRRAGAGWTPPSSALQVSARPDVLEDRAAFVVRRARGGAVEGARQRPARHAGVEPHAVAIGALDRAAQ